MLRNKADVAAATQALPPFRGWIPQEALSQPCNKSDEHENSDGADGSECAGHTDAHDDLKKREVFGHASGLTLFVKRSIAWDCRRSEAILVSI
jgi:hypothetical protein